MKNWPKKINIMGIEHDIVYCKDIADVDMDRDTGLWGQISFRTRSIRILKKDDRIGERSSADMFKTLLHEIMHGIIQYNPSVKIAAKNQEDVCETIALHLADTLIRNKLVDLPSKK